MGSHPASLASVTRWIERRLPTLLRAHDIEAAYLFGSRARGDADGLSDIDLIIVASSRRPFVERFRDYPDLLAAPAGVDLLVYTPSEFAFERRVNRFLRHALRDARRLA
jgi:predicted nucleotidyltransferase